VTRCVSEEALITARSGKAEEDDWKREKDEVWGRGVYLR
jgi:hypothetical protein